MQNFIALGKKIYNMENPREVHRMIVFVIRAYLNYGKMLQLDRVFQSDANMTLIAESDPYVYEQATRAFFYKGSTVDKRARLIEEHMTFLNQRFKVDSFQALYNRKAITLWEAPGENGLLKLNLFFEPGQRKEGLLSAILDLDGRPLYQIMFWIAKNQQHDWALWIGAMQGPNMENAKDIIRDITKQFFRYRTKNLILYMTMAIARALGVKHIYAVSNEGYYANNHVRSDRKLKTDFGAFWEEAGGHVTDDPRFYEIPLVEPRKTMEEVPTRKRAVYRKRFAFLDEVDAVVQQNMEQILK